jgi:hypothetical protein
MRVFKIVLIVCAVALLFAIIWRGYNSVISPPLACDAMYPFYAKLSNSTNPEDPELKYFKDCRVQTAERNVPTYQLSEFEAIGLEPKVIEVNCSNISLNISANFGRSGFWLNGFLPGPCDVNYSIEFLDEGKTVNRLLCDQLDEESRRLSDGTQSDSYEVYGRLLSAAVSVSSIEEVYELNQSERPC